MSHAARAARAQCVLPAATEARRPVVAYIDPTVPMGQADVVALRHRLDLGRSLSVQYIAWAGAAVRGDHNDSTQQDRALVPRCWPRGLVMDTELILATIIGMVFGIIAAVLQAASSM